MRPNLVAVVERHRIGVGEARPEAVARRRARGQRTGRENIADLCDPESFAEYGALNVAAQRQRRTLDELVRISPADGLVAGIGTVNHDIRCGTGALHGYGLRLHGFARTHGWTRPSDVASAALYLASDEAEFITGWNFRSTAAERFKPRFPADGSHRNTMA